MKNSKIFLLLIVFTIISAISAMDNLNSMRFFADHCDLPAPDFYLYDEIKKDIIKEKISPVESLLITEKAKETSYNKYQEDKNKNSHCFELAARLGSLACDIQMDHDITKQQVKAYKEKN